ncbi:MAG: hypothetical protein E6Q97_08685 [Desulfurellales bacterium]|nr:MAG: hypothetical protein E6Q97_08685 [Desulfurellales bacterium]
MPHLLRLEAAQEDVAVETIAATAKAKPTSGETPKAEPKKPEPETPKAEAAKDDSVPFETISLDQIQAELKKRPDARAKAISILKDMGKQKIGQLNETERAQFMVALGVELGAAE